jgi:IS30 family transposase
VNSKVWSDLAFFFGVQFSPKQIAAKVEVSHESIHLHVYANKPASGDLHQAPAQQKASAQTPPVRA